MELIDLLMENNEYIRLFYANKRGIEIGYYKTLIKLNHILRTNKIKDVEL